MPFSGPLSTSLKPGRKNSIFPRRYRPHYYIVEEDDAIKAYDEAGYLPLTNLVLETRPCERRKGPICRYCNFFRGDGGGVAKRPFVQFEGAAGPSPALANSAGQASAAVAVAVRSFFPETFLFQLEGLGGDGEVDLKQKMPDTITRWVGSAFCSNLKSGFGLSETASITTFKPFFAEINVPFSVKRGELLRLKVSVFNFLSTDLSVLVELAPSKDFSVDGGAPRSHAICVRADRPSVVEFPLQFSSLGDVDIMATVRAGGNACGKPNTVQASDALRRSLLVKPEGFPQEEVSTAFVCRPKGTPAATVVTFPLQLLPTLVRDSQRAWISVVGDLLAPSSANLERLVRVPTGCGEQNMIGFVPNIFVRRYLEEVKLITDALRIRTTNNMRTGYQRELRFRRREGSYSAFPERTPKIRNGSLWLTAYVVRSYAAASRYIAIDAKDLDISTRWIAGRQEATGEFSPHGALFHREMRGGVGRGGNEALTAYVVLALMEAGGQQAVVKRGLDFLVKTSVFSTLYAEVLVAHALVQSGRTEGATRLAALLKKGVRRGGQLHWEGDRSSVHGGSRAVDVEMTSYMVLSLLKVGGRANLGEAALAIKWVNTQRNSVGGFVSTQDTVVALAALTEFAVATYSPKMSVDVTASAQGGFSERISVTASTRLLTRQRRIPDPLKLPNSVKFEVAGEGCAVVQSLFRYNTKTAFPDPSFNLKANIIKKSSTCSTFTLSICASFKKPNTESNMAIIEIEMISGFVTVDKSLRDVEKEGVIQRWEFKEGKASLYFDEFTTTEVCFSVRFTQAVAVEKLKPAVVRIYDYYAVEDRFEVEYGPPCKT
ncbi:murinoglobulin-2-like [Pollicipes pollicipes]|uniref:murinoglobulin-2-like n=1 Tax=Pollicipes pollicipes TaxID=41117 RepID=UPI00188557C6|nr:murinoglobulin-2-like [Pollicipes pollicipes]